MWEVKSWQELTPTEIYQILDLRVSTFVVEQMRIYHEIDRHDLEALHVFLQQNNKVVAYARIFLTKDKTKITFGRVVISQVVRGKGLGAQLLEQIMNTIRERFPGKPIEIEAQVQVQDFYKQVGFRTVGSQFIFESTPHIKMVHNGLF